MSERTPSVEDQLEAIRKRQDEQKTVWDRIREINTHFDECGNLSNQDYNERERLYRRVSRLRGEDEMYMDSDYRVMLDELAALREQVAALTRERDALRELFREVQMTRIMSSSIRGWESCLQIAEKALGGEVALPDSEKLASVRQVVLAIDMDALSPIEALTKLYELRRLIQQN